MNTPLLERLAEHCHRLRLYQVEKELTARLEQAAKSELSYADFLDQLLALEVGSKAEKHHQMRIAMARFPFQKTLESFDFKFQPSIDPKLIRELATGRYMQGGDNVLLLGPPGVGKSHLAVALGIKACEQGVRTLFVTATALITTLGRAWAEGRLEDRLKVLTQPQLLIVDEIGYLPIDRQGANLFFQLVSRRYERGSIIITSNQSLGAWGRCSAMP
jgi:DNA replication protein DnaC